MKYIFAILGMVASFFIIKYRESLGQSFGEADWMRYVGGIYGLMVLIGILIFYWSLATLTGTEEIFFAPIIWLIPGMSTPPPS